MDMTLTADKPSQRKDWELTPAGTHVSTIFKIVNLGHLPVEWQGQIKDMHKIRIFWELPDEKKEFTDADGNHKVLPFAISKKVTLSMGEKSKLRPLVIGMTGAAMTDEEAYGFNVYSLLGHSCLVSITHEKSKDGNEFAVVQGCSPLIKGMAEPDAINPHVIWDVTKMTKEEIEELPEYIKEDMKESSEYRLRFLAPRGEKKDDNYPELGPDDIPF